MASGDDTEPRTIFVPKASDVLAERLRRQIFAGELEPRRSPGSGATR